MAIIKNGFKFHEIPLEIWNRDDDCLACHELSHVQTEVEFPGSWALTEIYEDGHTETHTYNTFSMQSRIYLENSTSKWVYIPEILYSFHNINSPSGGFARSGHFGISGVKPNIDLSK